MVPLLKKNINLNNTPGKLSVQDLDWTKWKEVAPKFKPPYDIVVGLNAFLKKVNMNRFRYFFCL